MNTNIIAASVFGLVLIGVAFVFANDKSMEYQAQSESGLNVVESSGFNRNFVAVSDIDNNGIPDWQEALHKTKLPEIEVVTEGEYEAPDTFTGEFAVSFLETYLNSRARGSLGQTPENLVENAATVFEQKALDKLYTKGDIIVTPDTNKEALRAYGNRIAEIAVSNSVPLGTRNEIDIVEEALQKSDGVVLEELTPIISSYENIVNDMLKLEVPVTYAQEHLDLINVHNAILIDITVMKDLFSDPLYAVLRIKRYDEDVLGLFNAISNLYVRLHEDGILWTPEDSALKFITINP